MNGPSALSRALDIGAQSRAARFDWPDAGQVVAKVEEEWRELLRAIESGDSAAMGEELGDLLFTVAQLARHLQLHPERALERANEKFLQRFARMEHLICDDNRVLSQLTVAEMETYWNKVKELERLKRKD